MKKIMFVLMFLIICAVQSKADDFVYTGYKAADIDPVGYMPVNSIGALGGPINNENLGFAQQFKIDQEIQMSFLNVHAKVSPYVGTTTFNYKLYSDSLLTKQGHPIDSPIPDQSSLVLKSEDLSFTTTEQDNFLGTVQETDMTIPFSYRFEPGTYWLATEGYGGAYVETSQTYVDPPINPLDKPMAAPEPSTWALMLLGLGFSLWKFKPKLIGV